MNKNAIKSVIGWPNAATACNRGEVPSESLYVDGEFYWGYAVKFKWQDIYDQPFDPAKRPIKFAKLLLADSVADNKGQETDNLARSPSPSSKVDVPPVPCEGLTQTLSALGKNVRDVIRDYLVEILLHTKSHLVKHESFKETSKVELVLSVPAGWPLKASWALQEILSSAVETVRFGDGFDLFFVNEPEAASAFALDQILGAKAVEVYLPYFHICAHINIRYYH